MIILSKFMRLVNEIHFFEKVVKISNITLRIVIKLVSAQHNKVKLITDF